MTIICLSIFHNPAASETAHGIWKHHFEKVSASLPGFTEFLSCVTVFRHQLTCERGTLIDFIVVLCRRDWLVNKRNTLKKSRSPISRAEHNTLNTLARGKLANKKSDNLDVRGAFYRVDGRGLRWPRVVERVIGDTQLSCTLTTSLFHFLVKAFVGREEALQDSLI